MNDLEQPMLSYYVIYFEKFRSEILRSEKDSLREDQYKLFSHIITRWP